VARVIDAHPGLPSKTGVVDYAIPGFECLRRKRRCAAMASGTIANALDDATDVRLYRVRMPLACVRAAQEAAT